MRTGWVNLGERDRETYRATVAFLDGRLEERATIDWALQLKPNDTVKRVALVNLIDGPAGQKLSEPWQSAWRLIEESWNSSGIDDSSTSAYDAQRRIRAGDRSGWLVTRIVQIVSPRLNVEPFSRPHLLYRQHAARPKKVEDLFSISLKSGKIVDPGMLGIPGITDRSFLLSLAVSLDAAVSKGIDIARRVGWCGEGKLWQVGRLYRVYYVPVPERGDGEREPDEFHRGIAPSVKLLHAVVSHLVAIDNLAATEFICRWKSTNSPIHQRLWAALSMDSRITPANEVAAWLRSLGDRCFWDPNDYPEISELRARRFSELEPQEQDVLTARIRRRPPRKQWPRKAEAKRVSNARFYWAVRELRRIEIGGASLPTRDKAWMDARISEFADLARMTRLDHGFLTSPEARWVPPRPDSQYDLLTGGERLKGLEAALSSARRGWDDDPAERAEDWIRHPGNTVQVLADLESVPDGGAAFPRVWERFGWAHSPAKEQGDDPIHRDMSAEGARVLSLLAVLPEMAIRKAIDGISHWLSTWEKQVVISPLGPIVWHRIWPIAVEATNAKQTHEVAVSLDSVPQSSDDQQPMDLDTLNTPAGKLVGVFLAACPNVKENPRAFEVDSVPRRMRDTIIATTGRSGLIARHRMIEWISYFLCASPDWTQEGLIAPLTADNLEALMLWRAIARQTRFSDVLKFIGGPMAERAADRRVDRETRRSLVFSLVIECLYAFWEQRDPAVPFSRIQQMLRSLDDEVRAYGADAVQRFVRDLSAPRDKGQDSPLPEELFRSAATPFLQHVWPQELSLATPGVSAALADLPATAGGGFADAVDIVERFLVPFECWSMADYGLYGEEDGAPKLSNIDNFEKAGAFLRLLDRTIGTVEGSVIPHELADALDQVRRVAPNLAEKQVFRRLATAARRG